MNSVVSERGQTVIPKEVRKQLGLKPNTKLYWMVRDGHATVYVIPDDPVRALRGVLKGKGSTDDLLEERRLDLEREEAKLAEDLARWKGTS